MYCQRRRSKLRWTSSSSLRQCSWLARVTAHTLKRPNRSSSMERNTNPYKNEKIITSLSQNILNQALAQHNIDPEKSEMIDIDLRDKIEMDEIQAYMKEVTYLNFAHVSCYDSQGYFFELQLTGASTVPRVFIGGHFLGGGDDTVAAHE